MSSSRQNVNGKEEEFVEDLDSSNEIFETTNSVSLLSDISTYLNGDNSGNFLVNVDSLPNETNASNMVKDILKDRQNVAFDTQFAGGQKADYYNSKYDGKARESGDKENIQTSKESQMIADIIKKHCAPTGTLMKRFIKPPLPSILEMSCEDGKALNLTSLSRASSISPLDVMENTKSSNKNNVLIDMQCKTSEKIVDRLISYDNVTTPGPSSYYQESKIHQPNMAASKIVPVSKSRSTRRGDNILEEYNHGAHKSWDDFDKIMDASLTTETLPKFIELSLTQRDMEFDDAGFRSFTSDEARDLMDKDEAERLQLMASPNSTFCFQNDQVNALDSNLSMGTYFAKRSSTPFKSDLNISLPLPEESGLKIIRKSSDDSSVDDDDLEEVFTSSPFSKQIKNSNVSLSESLQCEHENDEFGPLKLPDTSLDTLGRFFMGPESNYLSGNPKAMMEYIIDYCKQKAERSTSVQDEHITDKNTSKDKHQFTTRRSSTGSSGVSSLESNKTFRSKSGTLQLSEAHSNTFENRASSDAIDKSVLISGHCSSSKLSDSFLENSSDNSKLYNKFKEDLVQSYRNGTIANGLGRRHSSRRFQEYERDVAQPVSRKEYKYKDVVNEGFSNESTSAKKLSLEFLRRDSLSPPERLSTGSDLRKVSGISLSNSSGIPHSTPLQESLSASLAKQLGLGNIFSKYDAPNMQNTMESVKDDAQRPMIARYDYSDRNAVNLAPLSSAESQMNRNSNGKEMAKDLEKYQDVDNRNNRGSHRRAPKTNPHINSVSATTTLTRSTKTESSVQTSFLQPKPAVVNAAVPSATQSANQNVYTNQMVQGQNFGFPLIIQIHCSCNGGVQVGSSQAHAHSSAFAPAATTQINHQMCLEQTMELSKPMAVDAYKLDVEQKRSVQFPDVINKAISAAEKPSQDQRAPPPAFIDVDKMSLVWGFVDFGKTEMQTICLSNKQNVELRFKATIVENSFVKNFKFVLDPADPRIKDTERVGVLHPLKSRQLKVNYSPVKDGPITASILLSFHSVPYSGFGFKSEIPLIVKENPSDVWKKIRPNDANPVRAGDDIKIQNSNMNFGKVAVGNTSRKVVTVTNNGSSTVKFVVLQPTQDVKTVAHENPYTSSVFDGTIAKGSTREIIFTYRPTYFGKHAENWTLDVTFVYSSTQMTKSTTITLQGEGVKLP